MKKTARIVYPIKTFKDKLLSRPKSIIAVILYKGLIGLGESLAGLSLVVFGAMVENLHAGAAIQDYLAKQLQKDPDSALFGWLSSYDLDALTSVSLHAGLLFLVIGLAKLVIVAGVWYRSLIVRNIALIFLTGSVLYGFYTSYLHFSVIKVAILSLDVFFIYYFWRILPKYLKHDII